jgi:repressor LexA
MDRPMTDRRRERGYAPTVRELSAELGLRSPSAGQARLRSLERVGVISRGNGRARIVRIHGDDD